jgi:hypothetical protein
MDFGVNAGGGQRGWGEVQRNLEEIQRSVGFKMNIPPEINYVTNARMYIRPAQWGREGEEGK